MEAQDTPLDIPKPETPSSPRNSLGPSAQDLTPSVPCQHEHSDSLVTIRLSDTHSKDLEQIEDLKDAAVDTTNEQDSRSAGKILQADSVPLVASDNAATIGATELGEVESAISSRVSRVRFDTEVLDNLKEDPDASREGDGSEQLDEQKPGSSKLSSNLGPNDSAIDDDEVLDSPLEQFAFKKRSQSTGSSSSESAHVDWAELDKNEEQEQRDEGTDEVWKTQHHELKTILMTSQSTAFLLARLEQENNALATNPKAGMAHPRARSASRPPSFHQLKKLVSEPTRPSLRYSLLPSPPPMTELEFWTALVRDYPQTALRLPTLTSNKIRSGIPPPLRGVVWVSIAGARNNFLEDEYDRLSVEPSPYEKLIHKDVGRSFPGVDMFRDADGAGQKMLSKVLNAFSLFDQEIGYCQGLGFVVGPLLMHMGDKEAFCVLVR